MVCDWIDTLRNALNQLYPYLLKNQFVSNNKYIVLVKYMYVILNWRVMFFLILGKPSGHS